MLDMIINTKLEDPYDKFASDSQNLPTVSKCIMKSKLSKKIQEISLTECDENYEKFSNTFVSNFIRKTGKLKENKKLNQIFFFFANDCDHN